MPERSYFDAITHTIDEIRDTYGDDTRAYKSVVKSIDKWGQTEVLGSTLRTVWLSDDTNETYQTAAVEVYFQKRTLGQAFRTFVNPVFLGEAQPALDEKLFPRPLIIEPNSDFRVLAQTIGTSPASNVSVTARISGILLRKV